MANTGSLVGLTPFPKGGKVLSNLTLSCYQSFKRYSLFGYYGLGSNLIQLLGRVSEASSIIYCIQTKEEKNMGFDKTKKIPIRWYD